MNNRLIKSNDAGGGGCTNTVDLYNPFPDGGGVALYQLNGDATDVSGNYDGTISGTIPFVAGQFGQAANIGPSDDYINTGINPSSFSVATISCWFKRNGVPSNSRHMIWGTATTTDIFGIVEVGSDAWIGNNTGTSFPVTTFNEWNHIVIIANNSVFSTYLNGQLIDSNLPNTLPSFSNTNSYLGRSVYGAFHQMNGDLDQVRIFNRALRPYEVEALYTEEYCTPTIVPSEHFNTVLYTGDRIPKAIGGVGFQPDLVWIKDRNLTEPHAIFDSIRGAGNIISSNRTNAEFNSPTTLTSFNSDGFSLGTDDIGFVNYTGRGPYVAWCWKAGGAAVTNTDGTITSQVSANTEAGFSIVKFNPGFVSSGQSGTVGHGLSSTPKIIITKSLDTTINWWSAIDGITGNQDDYIALNLTNPKANLGASAPFGRATSSNFTISYAFTSTSSNLIAYCFAEVEGFSNFGSYVGTGTTSGNVVVTGFEPAFVMIKCSSKVGDSSTHWVIKDNKRDTTNPNSANLYANLSNAEDNVTTADVNFFGNGFQPAGTFDGINESGQTYIYMAFAADPTAVEPTLEDSFNTVVYSGNGTGQSINTVGFAPDLVWVKNRFTTNYHILSDTVRGENKQLYSNTADSEQTDAGFITGFNIDGFDIGNAPSTNTSGTDNYVAWNWKGAEIPAINSNGSIPSVVSANPAAGFSIVSYTNTTSGTADSNYTVGHGLSSAPELIITKVRNVDGYRWTTYNSFNGTGQYMALNETRASTAFSRAFPVAPNSSVFTLDEAWPHPVGGDAITYCFHSVPGFSKFGSYVGTGSVGNIQTLGFEPAFILIKRTDNVDNWWIYDNKRDTTNPNTETLMPNSTSAEYSGSPYTDLNFLSNGFEPIGTNLQAVNNGNGATYIYMAFANQF